MTRAYWEERAERFSREDEGWKAVCSYGMPAFYNRAIDRAQRRALEPWLSPGAGVAALDLGCGVGRWSRELAERGAHVVGVDLSEAMLADARRRTVPSPGVGSCTFLRQDIAELDVAGAPFGFALGVTVLQHLVQPDALRRAIGRLHQHLGPGARAVFLEAAPRRDGRATETGILRVRSEADYVGAFEGAGFAVADVTGVDPPGWKYRALPLLPRLPRPVGTALLAAATWIQVPVESLLGRRLRSASWHKVFVLERR